MSYVQVVTDTLALLIAALSLLPERKPAIMSALLMLLIEVHSLLLTAVYACALPGAASLLWSGSHTYNSCGALLVMVHSSLKGKAALMPRSVLHEGLGPLYQLTHVVNMRPG